MPNPSEIATIVVGGKRFSTWKTASVGRTFLQLGSIAEVTLTEPAASGAALAAASPIVVGAPAQVLLAGILVLDGFIAMVQRVLTPEQHGVLVRINSKTISVVNSSVKTSPGQFKGYTTSALINSILSPFGITFKYANGAPPGAENVFERVSLNIGESVHAALSRLANMRNLYFCDDAEGNIVATRATGSENATAQITEGKTLKSGVSILRNDSILSAYQVTGQNFANDTRNGDQSRAVSASATVAGAQPGTSKVVTMPMPGSPADAAMVTSRAVAADQTAAFEITIVLQGWFATEGTLWLQLVGQKIVLNSPSLLPASFDQSAHGIYVYGVQHKQGETGTETEIHLCNQEALGANPIGAPDAVDAAPPAPASVPTDSAAPIG